MIKLSNMLIPTTRNVCFTFVFVFCYAYLLNCEKNSIKLNFFNWTQIELFVLKTVVSPPTPPLDHWKLVLLVAGLYRRNHLAWGPSPERQAGAGLPVYPVSVGWFLGSSYNQDFRFRRHKYAVPHYIAYLHYNFRVFNTFVFLL